MQCLNCEAELEEVFAGGEKHYQFVDALHIQVHLGYGEFADQTEHQVASPQGCFCKACAENLIEQFPGIEKLLHL